MSNTISCGILLFRKNKNIEFFLAHPGGVYNKNAKWGLPKGHLEKSDANKKDAAIREFLEETGANITFDKNKLISLGSVKQNKHKTVYVWAYEFDLEDDFKVRSNLIWVEFPKKSGKFIEVPEIDDGKYFSFDDCKKYMLESQFLFVELLYKNLTGKII